MVAIVLGVPDFIDRLTGPSSCIFCFDLHGVDFIFILFIFGPVALVLPTGALLLRPGRMWPSWVALAVNLAVVGSLPLTIVPFITGWGAAYCSEMCDSLGPSHVPLLVQHLQGLLLAVPALASLALVVALLGLPLIRPSRPRSTAPGT